MATKEEYDAAKEKRLVASIYKRLADVRLPIDDASVILESLFRENGYSSIMVNHKSIPLSRARGYLSNYASSLLLKYNLPSDPIDNPDINMEMPSLPEPPEQEKPKKTERTDESQVRELTRNAKKNLESRMSGRVFKEEEAEKFYDIVREYLQYHSGEVIGKITSEPFGMSSKRKYEILGMVLEETGVQSKDEEEFFSVGMGNVRFYLKDFRIIPDPASNRRFAILKKDKSLEETLGQPQI